MIPEPLILRQTDLWTWSLFPNQCYLGRVQLTLRRQCQGWLADLNDAEWVDLRASLDALSALLNDHFQPDRFNVKQLGNQWPQVHVHLVPRYHGPRTWNGITFKDERWGDDPYPEFDSPIDEAATHEMARWLRSELGGGAP